MARVPIWKPAAVAAHDLPAPQGTAIAKTYAGEIAIEVTNAALQIFGATGYSREFPLERMLRDARMFTIGGGTAQVQRNVIASHLLGKLLTQRADRELLTEGGSGVIRFPPCPRKVHRPP